MRSREVSIYSRFIIAFSPARSKRYLLPFHQFVFDRMKTEFLPMFGKTGFSGSMSNVSEIEEEQGDYCQDRIVV